MSKLVVVAEFGSRHEAELAKSYLDGADLPSVLSVDDSGGALAGLSLSGPARILVRPEDAERARTLLDDAELD
jgi:hypothetical protein